MAFGLVIASPVALFAEAPTGRGPDLWVSTHESPAPFLTSDLEVDQDNGDRWGWVGTDVAVHSAAVDALIGRDRIDVFSRDLTPFDLEESLIASLLPRWISYRGGLCLHAAAVKVGNGAVLLQGPSMVGKSTLSLAFARQGFAVLADDMVRVEPGLECWSTFLTMARTRLRHETAGAFAAEVSGRHDSWGKLVVEFASEVAPDAPVPLQVIFALDPTRGEDFYAERMSAAASLQWVSKHALHGGPDRATMNRQAFGQLMSLLAGVPVVRVGYPRGFDRLERVCSYLLGLVEEGVSE